MKKSAIITTVLSAILFPAGIARPGQLLRRDVIADEQSASDIRVSARRGKKHVTIGQVDRGNPRCRDGFCP